MRFRFDGVEYEGQAGDTLAAALVRNGVLGGFRSIYRDRPRGVFTADEQEPNALVQVGAEPLLRATLVELEEGLEAAPLAGKGRLTAVPYGRCDAMYANCDVLVIGGGRSGMAAADAAAGRVLVLEQGPEGATASLRSVADVDVGEQICLGRQRGGFGLADGLVDHGHDFGIGCVEVRPGELAGLGHPVGEALQAVQFGPGVLDLAGPAGSAGRPRSGRSSA